MNNDIKKMLEEKKDMASVVDQMRVAGLFKYLELLNNSGVKDYKDRVTKVCDAIEAKLGL